MSDKNPNALKLMALRQQMKEKGIDTVIITKFDPHNTEYTPDYWNGVKFISGFSGSAAVVAVTMNKAGLWTDGRYYIQAEKELEGTGIDLYREPEATPIMTWVKDETPIDGCIGFNGLTMSAQVGLSLKKKTDLKNITINCDVDFISDLWHDRAPLAVKPVYEHTLNFCGESRVEKIKRFREAMRQEDAHVYILSSLDDIAWLLNLRGNDFENATLFSSYVALEEDKLILFIDQAKISGHSGSDGDTASVADLLKQDGIEIKAYDEIFSYAKELERKKTVMLSPGHTSYYLYKSLEGCRFIEADMNITTNFKAVKNETELTNWDKCCTRDGVAMVRFIKWLKETVKEREIPETEIHDKLQSLRATGENYLMPSFDTIAAYMENAAQMHYHPVPDSCSNIGPQGFLLVDTGGNYLDGTTDITRTFVLGSITEEMKKDFTLVLKSHIRMAKAIFLHGATGSNLDILARQPMWESGMDYKCGTGHGIGYCLNVHEGPQRISMLTNCYKLEPGMVITNEPGIYKKGRYGIRTENLIKVVPHKETEDGSFLCFETFSYCPIDLQGIDKTYLSIEEVEWLNTYHKTVYEKLSPYLSPEEDRWLATQTAEI